MAWTNLFLVSWPLQEVSREIVTMALSLQLMHYLANMAVLMFLVVLFPTSYPVVLGILACGVLSIWPLYRLRKEVREEGFRRDSGVIQE